MAPIEITRPPLARSLSCASHHCSFRTCQPAASATAVGRRALTHEPFWAHMLALREPILHARSEKIELLHRCHEDAGLLRTFTRPS